MGGGRSQAGNHGFLRKLEDATDRNEVGEHRRVNPKVPGLTSGSRDSGSAPQPSPPKLLLGEKRRRTGENEKKEMNRKGGRGGR